MLMCHAESTPNKLIKKSKKLKSLVAFYIELDPLNWRQKDVNQSEINTTTHQSIHQ